MDFTEVLSQVCRTCANKIKDKDRQQNLFNFKRGKLLNQLKLITGLELSQNESKGLPDFICERCQSELDLAVKFRERCIFSQKYLFDMQNKGRGGVQKKSDNLDEQLIDEVELAEFDDEDEFAGFEVEEPQDEDDDDGATAVLAAAEAAHEAELIEQQMRQAAKRRRNFFICEECGQLYDDEYAYNEHLDVHVDAENLKTFFPCKKCPATFKTKNLLKQHNETHCGDPVFKCSICGEKFAVFGAKLRHEKAHDNERPYPCLECDQIFSSVFQLKAHAAIHAAGSSTSNVKFRCDHCNCEFSDRKELINHTKTRAHKRSLKQTQQERDLAMK